jgi:hypothetical protein
MLASRLVRAAQDVVEEYARFKIIDKVNEAILIARQRDQANEIVYRTGAEQLRRWAKSVLDQSIFNNYPPELLLSFENSKYSAGLPKKIATVILNGFPGIQNRAMSSSELGVYHQAANMMLSDFNALIAVAMALGIHQIAMPEDELGFDITIPTKIFDDNAASAMACLEAFIRLMSSLAELVTGSSRAPTLLYASTPDLAAGLGLVLKAAPGFTMLINSVLDAATKIISLWKTVRDLMTVSPESAQEVGEKVKNAITQSLEASVSTDVSGINSALGAERVNELKISISKECQVILDLITEGARVGITIESRAKLQNLLQENNAGAKLGSLSELLKTQAALQQKLETAIESSGGTGNPLRAAGHKDAPN